MLTVSFAEVENGTVSGLFDFTQDTDNDIRIQIPEPALLPLFGLGLAGFAIIAHSRRSAQTHSPRGSHKRNGGLRAAVFLFSAKWYAL